MSTYRASGKRFLRKYTEPHRSPVSAVELQAQTIVRDLCSVPWEAVADRIAQTTSHTESDLDANVQNRNKFDAALFCAEHSDGQHRAYANAATYRYTMPDSAVGNTLQSIKATVNTDYFNSQGVRLHVFTNSTGEIPMNCRTVRGEDANGDIIEDGTTAAGVAKRTVTIVNKQETWHATAEVVTLSPTGGLTLQKYLFLVVALESYSTVRVGSNWLEGSSFIANDVQLTLASACADLSADVLNDLSHDDSEAVEFNVVKGGVTQSNYGVVSGLYGIEVLTNGDSLDDVPKSSNGVYDPADVDRCNASDVFANQVIGLRTLYARFYKGQIKQVVRTMNDRLGAGFRVGMCDKEVQVGQGGTAVDGTLRLWRMSMSSLAVSFSVPTMFEADKIRLEWPNWLQPYKATGRFNVWLMRGQFLEALPDAVLKNPDIYIGGNSSVAGWEMLGTIDAAVFYDTSIRSKTFNLSEPLVGRVATLLITAYASADGYNPEGSTGEYANGTMRVGVDSANNALVDYDATGGADLFKPDITLLGYSEVDDNENPGDGETYTVTLNGNGGSGGDSSATAVYGADMPALEAVPTKTYNTFQGYYDATTGGTRYYGPDGASAHVWDKTSSATLYARWRAIRVTFDANGGSVSPAYADVDGTTGKVTLPTPTLSGNTMTGWYTAAIGGTKVGDAGDEYSPSGDVTLYAHWQDTYTVTLDATGGTGGLASVSAVLGADMPTLTVLPSKAYHNFDGYFDFNATRYYTSLGYSAHVWDKTSSATLYASWKAFRVTFDANGGSVSPAYADVDGTTGKVTLPAATFADGVFAGWYTAATGGTKVGDAGDEYSPSGDVTLYAHWMSPLCFTAQQANSTISMTRGPEGNEAYVPSVSLQTSYDGVTWTPFVVGETMITLTNIGDKVYFAAGTGGNLRMAEDAAENRFVMTGLIAASGDISSLLDNSASVTDLTGRANCFEGLFYGCTSLTTAPRLPATTLASHCYFDMFHGCTSLTTAPELPATTLATYCYFDMFRGCTSLTSIAVQFEAFSPANATSSWLYQISPYSNGTFRCPTALANSGFTRNADTVPANWTIVTN